MESLVEATPAGLHIEELIGFSTFNNNLPGVLALVFNQPSSVAGFNISKQTSLLALVWPRLTAVIGAAGSFVISTNPLLNSLSAPLLESVPAALTISNNATLPAIDLRSLVTIGTNLDFSNNTFLASVLLPKYLPTNTRNVTLSGCALSQASVDHVLARCVASPGYVSGIVNLSGGTSAPPSATGLLDKATLQARGVTVMTN